MRPASRRAAFPDVTSSPVSQVRRGDASTQVDWCPTRGSHAFFAPSADQCCNPFDSLAFFSNTTVL
ncbi:MAG: hypothetical protein ACYDHT_03765 [Solirubrobacteraceae bacterium]